MKLKNKSFLIVGGAGYIGSHMTLMLHELGYQVLVLDNLSTGYKDAIIGAKFIQADIHDSLYLDAIFKQYDIDMVLHFAAYIDVAESVRDPFKYYRNNVVGTQTLLESMVKNGVKHIIFSSTAAIFGEPRYVPIDEAHDKDPINPYGHGKLIIEQMLEKYDFAYDLKSICLRYFNAAGADPQARIGERHEPETHLIPLVLQAASGRRSAISVYGSDYETKDGTCVRDYVHIMDLCDAHLLAAEFLLTENQSLQFNLGNGNGYSVQQVIDVAKQVTQRPIQVDYTERRPGDPAKLVANAALAKKTLNWQPKFGDLDEIIEHAWRWETQQSH